MRVFFLIAVILLSALSHAKDTYIYSTDSNQSSPPFKTLSLWLELVTEKNPGFYELTSFIKKHSNWPKQDLLKLKVEESDLSSCNKKDVMAWFKANPPKTINGQKKYVSMLDDSDLRRHYIRLIWNQAMFNKSEESKFLKTYSKLLTEEDYINRLNYLLFNRKTEQAERLLPYLNKSKPIYQTRIFLQKGKLQYSNQQDIGVLYDLATIYESQNEEEKLIKVLKKASEIDNKHQMYFWPMKAKLIRKLVQEKKYDIAYLFASTHSHIGAKESSEAEWLAGWVALRFLNKPSTAITHFTNFYNKVKMPISLARGSYWLARSYEELKNIDKSKYWYQISAKYSTSFYGQLSICKINECKVKLPDETPVSEKSIELFSNNELAKAAVILNDTKYDYLVQDLLFKAIANTNDQGEIILITRLGFKLEKLHLSVEAAKHASYKDVHSINNSYPILKNIYKDHSLDVPLVLALIRQESVFNHKAVSSAGAMGLMQIMPHVAKQTAAEVKVRFHKNKLINDPYFNTMLGVNHLAKLLNEYDGSNILAIAAYNAGSKAVAQWIDNNGDPRFLKNLYEIIDWLEKITFHETRNYVQRVLEGKSVYNMLINKEHKLSLLVDIGNNDKRYK